ncbi:MAG: hypothetical protein ACD_7C00188G0002 [uncultured bacterium]|nr:MAG: hypothetical protein ACD_7C00188G0002 [uncultured bacterium]
MENTAQHSWLKKINRALLKLDTIPIMRSYAPFDFEKFSEHLQKKFSLKNLKIETGEKKWLTKDQIKSGFSDNINYLAFTLSPLEGNAFLLMDLEDIAKLTNELLTHTSKIKFSTIMLQESFFRFAALEALDDLTQLNLFQDLSVKMVENADFLNEDAFCIDLKIKINNITLFARIAINENLRKAWEEYFVNNPPLKAFDLAKTLDLIIAAELGYVKLNYHDLKKIKIGDFIILDKINYDLKHNKGQVTLKLGDTSICLAKLKQNKLEIIDLETYQEEPNMEEKKISDASKEEEIEVQEEKEIPSSSLENMPITIIVEAARFKMNLEKLMNLQPGNLLDLSINPLTHVNLVVNGQKIGSAELVNLGETLGIRILELG